MMDHWICIQVTCNRKPLWLWSSSKRGGLLRPLFPLKVPICWWQLQQPPGKRKCNIIIFSPIFPRDLYLEPLLLPYVDYCHRNMRMASTHLLGLTLTDYIMVSSEGKKVLWGWCKQWPIEDTKVFGLAMTLLRQEAEPTPGLQFPSVQHQSLPRPKAFPHGDPRHFFFWTMCFCASES